MDSAVSSSCLDCQVSLIGTFRGAVYADTGSLLMAIFIPASVNTVIDIFATLKVQVFLLACVCVCDGIPYVLGHYGRSTKLGKNATL